MNPQRNTIKKRPSFLLQVSNISYNVFKRGGTKRKEQRDYEEVTLGNTRIESVTNSTNNVYDYAEINV